MADQSTKSLRGLGLIIFGVVAISLIWKSAAPKEIIPWQKDYSSARAQATAQHKPLFLDFTADWCGPCQSLKSTTWANVKVKAALAPFVPVQIDIDKHPELAQKYQVDSIPAFFVIDPTNDRILKESRSGALDPDQFLNWVGPSK